MKPLNLLSIIKQQNISATACLSIDHDLVLFSAKRFDDYQQLRQQREGSKQRN